MSADIKIFDSEIDEWVSISIEQQGNLRLLASHLLSLPAEYPSFAMSTFTNDGQGWGPHVAHKAECGTAACAVGHGPLIGLDPLPGETWTSYSERLFIADHSHEAWEWCFGGDWATVDNTAHGAAHRINWMLELRDIPDNAYAQRAGFDDIEYWPEAVVTLA